MTIGELEVGRVFRLIGREFDCCTFRRIEGGYAFHAACSVHRLMYSAHEWKFDDKYVDISEHLFCIPCDFMDAMERIEA